MSAKLRQLRFPRMPKPPRPMVRTEYVARAVAKRIVADVNLDEFYWSEEEVPERILDIQHEIMRVGRPATVFGRLYWQQPIINDAGERSGHPYGWEGIDAHCRAIASEIAAEELRKAVKYWEQRYG